MRTTSLTAQDLRLDRSIYTGLACIFAADVSLIALETRRGSGIGAYLQEHAAIGHLEELEKRQQRQINVKGELAMLSCNGCSDR